MDPLLQPSLALSAGHSKVERCPGPAVVVVAVGGGGVLLSSQGSPLELHP